MNLAEEDLDAVGTFLKYPYEGEPPRRLIEPSSAV